MTPGRVLAALLLIALWAICDPIAAHAWTPGTHIYLGETILANLHLLPASIATLPITEGAFSLTIVPAPATALTALLGLGVFARRRR